MIALVRFGRSRFGQAIGFWASVLAVTRRAQTNRPPSGCLPRWLRCPVRQSAAARQPGREERPGVGGLRWSRPFSSDGMQPSPNTGVISCSRHAHSPSWRPSPSLPSSPQRCQRPADPPIAAVPLPLSAVLCPSRHSSGSFRPPPFFSIHNLSALVDRSRPRYRRLRPTDARCAFSRPNRYREIICSLDARRSLAVPQRPLLRLAHGSPDQRSIRTQTYPLPSKPPGQIRNIRPGCRFLYSITHDSINFFFGIT